MSRQSTSALEENIVHVRLFGALELSNRRGTAGENRARQSLSWLLLKYLLANPGREVGSDELEEKLWPISSGEGNGAERVRLRRLREALAPLGLDGRDGLVLYSRGKYILNPDFELLSDEDELLRLMARIRMGGSEALSLCTQALELLRGEYLEYTDAAPWLERHREYYRRESAWLCGEALRLCVEGQKTAPLGLICRRACSLAPGEEALHRAIIGYLIQNKMEIELLRHISHLSRSGRAPWLDME